jgi:hypothetical protein
MVSHAAAEPIVLDRFKGQGAAIDTHMAKFSWIRGEELAKVTKVLITPGGC